MSRSIAVRPAAFGWSLRIDSQEGVLVFQTGAQAELVARRLARRLADAGEPTEVLIFLRDGSLAGRLSSTPPIGDAPCDLIGVSEEPAAA